MEVTVQTVIRTYCFDIRILADRAAYQGLCEKLAKQDLKCLESPESHYRKELDGLTVTLTKFSDGQWNTAPIPDVSEAGLRVSDWAQDHQPNYSLTIKRGYYLDQTDEMRQARC